MEETIVNPYLNTIILSCASFLIALLVGMVAYFLKQKDKRQQETNDRLYVSIEKLSKTISGLNAIILTDKERITGLAKRFDEHKVACDDKFIKK